MKIFCCYTPAHEVLFERYFRPSLPSGLALEAAKISLSGAGDFLSEEFLHCIREKVKLIRQSVLANIGSTIIWSDVDIMFFRSPMDDVQDVFQNQESPQILFQREAKRLPEVNTGFMVMRCSSQLAGFFSDVLDQMKRLPGLNEQAVINQNLTSDLHWSYLPWTYYARTQGWPPPINPVIYHANYTKGADGVGQKIAQLEEIKWIQRFGLAAYGWSCVRRLPAKLISRGA